MHEESLQTMCAHSRNAYSCVDVTSGHGYSFKIERSVFHRHL